METELLAIINTVLANRGKPILSKLDPNSLLKNEIGFDSLDLAELTVRIEVEVGIDIFEDGIVLTVAEILAKINK